MSLKVYKASAGSGKTFQLALEYIALALSNESPKSFTHILAVTFTNKATTEMKDRILAQLYNLGHGQKDRTFFEELQKKLPSLTADEIGKRALETLKAIVHDYDHFRVETIDSFFQSLLSSLAHELNLSRNFRVNLDDKEVISKAVDRLLTSLEISKENNVTSLILKYMEEQINDDKGWNISRELKSFTAKNLFNETYLKNEETLRRELNDPKQLNKFKNTLITDRKTLSKPIKEHATELLKLLSSTYEGANPEKIKSYKGIRNFTLSVLTDNYTDEVKPTVSKGADDWKVLLTKPLQSDATYQSLAQQISNHLAYIIPHREEIALFMTTSDLVLQKLTPLVLLNAIGHEVSKINHETGSFLLAKTPDLFNKMVRNNDSSFVFERSGTTFKHVMIDEFQDTSGSQWQNFKTLLLENMAKGDEGMLVGDIKQSIYRWRGGNWKILGNVEKEMSHLGKVDVKTLSRNFRSQREIIDFNNNLFKFIADFFNTTDNQSNVQDLFPYVGKENIISRIYEDVTQESNPSANKGYVRAALIKKDIEKEDIMQDLCEQILFLNQEKHIPFDQMGVLVRRNKETVQIIEYISEHYPQLPITSDEAFKLSASPCVRLLINSIKYLINPEDTVALELSHRLTATISQISALPITHTLDELIPQREELVNKPLSELCYWLIDYYQLPQAEKGQAGQSAYLFSFIDQMRSFIDENTPDINKFLEYWDESLSEKAIAVDVKDSVYVMTIHKSKGLQRHTILIPFCDWVLDKDFSDDMIWCDTSHLSAPFNQISLVPISSFSSKKVRSSAFRSFYEQEHLEQYIDGINELYVALTRAEHNLLLWSQESRNKNQINSLLQAYFDQESPENTTLPQPTNESSWDIHTFGEPHEYTIKENKHSDNPLETNQAEQFDIAIKTSPIKTEFRQSNKAQDFINSLHDNDAEQEETTAEQTISENQRNYINRGKLLHQIFSLINTPNDIGHAIHTLVLDGLIDDRKEEDSLTKFISKRLSNPEVTPWFDGTWQLFTECNILTRDKQNKVRVLRPDRVIQKENQTLVIDYKFGNFNPEYIVQVQQYMNALKQMGCPNVHGYLWFVYKDKIQEVLPE